jgi:hypothetical protein
VTRGVVWLIVGAVVGIGGPAAAWAIDLPAGAALPFVFGAGVAIANGLRTMRESL